MRKVTAPPRSRKRRAPSDNAHQRTAAVERGASPWLGRGVPASPVFDRYQQIERSLTPPWPAAGVALAPATTGGAFLDWWGHPPASPPQQWGLAHPGAAQWLRRLR